MMPEYDELVFPVTLRFTIRTSSPRRLLEIRSAIFEELDNHSDSFAENLMEVCGVRDSENIAVDVYADDEESS